MHSYLCICTFADMYVYVRMCTFKSEADPEGGQGAMAPSKPLDYYVM